MAGAVDVTSPALLLLADGRFPTGGHAHSGGLEAAVRAGLVADVDDLAAWARGALHTVWATDAAAAAHGAGLAVGGEGGDREDGGGRDGWARLDAELAARTPSTALRRAQRTLGRQLLRTAGRAWRHAALDLAAGVHPEGPLLAVANGAVAGAAGLGPGDAALLSLHQAVQGAGTAAVRLLGLDPFAVAALTAALGTSLRAVADGAVAAGADPADLPAAGAPMLDVLAADHVRADARLFAS